jgi:glycosyltransferase 2 family protein
MAEFAFSELMSDFSQSAFLLATMAVIWRLISYLPYLIIGSIILPNQKKNNPFRVLKLKNSLKSQGNFGYF